MSRAWIAVVVMVAALGGGCEALGIRPELVGLLNAQDFENQFKLIETLLGTIGEGKCTNLTQDAVEESKEMESEGEGTTVTPESEEEENLDDYTKIHPNHTLLLPPNADNCDVNRTGITDEEKDFILTQHNELRSKVAIGNETRGDPGPQPPAANMHQLVWNDELAKVAQAWAAQCPNGHDEERKRRLISRKYRTGQNINYYWGNADEGTDWQRAIYNWYNEVKDVDAKIAAAFIPPINKKIKIGHYTQFIWGNTKEIGCGIVHYATTRKGFFYPYSVTYVCNYGPAGNLINQPFYKHGEAATECPEEVSMEYPALCV